MRTVERMPSTSVAPRLDNPSNRRLVAPLVLALFGSGFASDKPVGPEDLRAWIGFGSFGIGTGSGVGVQRSLIAGLRWPESSYYGVVDLTMIDTEDNSSELFESEESPTRTLQAPILLIAVIRKFGRHGIHLGVGVAESQSSLSGYSTRTYNTSTDRYGVRYHDEETSTTFASAVKLAYLYDWKHVGIGCGATGLSSGHGIVYANLALGWI